MASSSLGRRAGGMPRGWAAAIRSPAVRAIAVKREPVGEPLSLTGAELQEAMDEKAPLVVTSLAEAFDALSVVDPKFEPVAIPSRPSEGTDSI